jgi:hypothetical protein
VGQLLNRGLDPTLFSIQVMAAHLEGILTSLHCGKFDHSTPSQVFSYVQYDRWPVVIVIVMRGQRRIFIAPSQF